MNRRPDGRQERESGVGDALRQSFQPPRENDEQMQRLLAQIDGAIGRCRPTPDDNAMIP